MLSNCCEQCDQIRYFYTTQIRVSITEYVYLLWLRDEQWTNCYLSFGRNNDFFCSKALKLALEATKLLIHLDTEALTGGLRQMGRAADQLSLSKILLSYTSTPPYSFVARKKDISNSW